MWTTLPRESTERPHIRNMLVSSPNGFCSRVFEGITTGSLWKALQRDLVGKHHSCNHLGNTTKGFYQKASRLEPFGKHRKTDFSGKLHNRNNVDSTTKGCHLERVTTGIFGRYQKGVLLESPTIITIWARQRMGCIGKHHNRNHLERTLHVLYGNY